MLYENEYEKLEEMIAMIDEALDTDTWEVVYHEVSGLYLRYILRTLPALTVKLPLAFIDESVPIRDARKELLQVRSVFKRLLDHIQHARRLEAEREARCQANDAAISFIDEIQIITSRPLTVGQREYILDNLSFYQDRWIGREQVVFLPEED